MKSISLSIALDAILSLLATFILSFCIFRIFSITTPISIILALIISASISLIITLRNTSINKKRIISGKLSREKLALLEKLVLLPKIKIIDILKGLLEANGINFIKNDDFLETENRYLVPLILPEQLSVNDITKTLSNIIFGDKIITLVFFALDQKASSFCERKNIQLLSFDEIFLQIKKHQPELIKDDYRKKQTIVLSRLIEKKSGKRFLLYGITLEFFSLISFYPIYYVFCGTLFIIFGLITTFFGKTKPKTSLSFEKV